MRVAVIKKVRCKAKRHKVAQNCSNDMGRRFRVGKTSFGIGVVLGSSLGYPDSITNHLLQSLQKNTQVIFSVMSQADEAAAVTRLYRLRCRLCVDTVCVMKHSSVSVILNRMIDMWSTAVSVETGCAGNRAVSKKRLGQDYGTQFAMKNDVCCTSVNYPTYCHFD